MEAKELIDNERLRPHISSFCLDLDKVDPARLTGDVSTLDTKKNTLLSNWEALHSLDSCPMEIHPQKVLPRDNKLLQLRIVVEYKECAMPSLEWHAGYFRFLQHLTLEHVVTDPMNDLASLDLPRLETLKLRQLRPHEASARSTYTVTLDGMPNLRLVYVYSSDVELVCLRRLWRGMVCANDAQVTKRGPPGLLQLSGFHMCVEDRSELAMIHSLLDSKTDYTNMLDVRGMHYLSLERGSKNLPNLELFNTESLVSLTLVRFVVPLLDKDNFPMLTKLDVPSWCPIKGDFSRVQR